MAFRIWGRNTNLYYLHISGFISVFMGRTHSKVVKITFVSEFYKIKEKTNYTRMPVDCIRMVLVVDLSDF